VLRREIPVRKLLALDPQAPPLLHLSKGVHVVLPAQRLPVNHVVIYKAGDGRLIFAIRHGLCVYIGTTDTTHEPGHEFWPEVRYRDVAYLLEPTARCFRIDPIQPEEVIATWAGLRPLIAQPGKPPTEISRRDEVLIGPAGVVTMAGGKLTGYRLMARETLEKAAEICELGLGPLPEDEPPLPGGDFDGDLAALEASLVREFGLAPACFGVSPMHVECRVDSRQQHQAQAQRQQDFQQRRQHVEQHEGQQELDPLGAALDHPRQAAGLAFQVKAERERVKMPESPERDQADRVLGDPGENRVAQLAEAARQDARRAIGQQQAERDGKHDLARRR